MSSGGGLTGPVSGRKNGDNEGVFEFRLKVD